MHRFFHFVVTGEMVSSQNVLEWLKGAIVRRNQLTTTWRMLQHLKVKLAEAFEGLNYNVRKNIITQHYDAFLYETS
jgi:hypothetical protein